MTGKYLITTDNWFIAPDGEQYRAAWGEAEVLQDDILGIKTNRNSSNWYVRLGSENGHIIIAGCQIHYAIKCEEAPNFDPIKIKKTKNGVELEKEEVTRIYYAQS